MPGTTDKDPEERTRQICLRALERRRRTRRELVTLLARKGVNEDVATPVLDRLDDVGLIDDEGYARAWVEDRLRIRPKGRRALTSELRGKGVADEVVNRVLDELLDPEREVDAARRAVASKLRSLGGLPAREARRKAEQFLLRRGFSYAVAHESLLDLLRDEDTDA